MPFEERGGLFPDSWHVDIECGSPVRLAIDSNAPAVLLKDPIASGETKTCSLSHFLCREKGLEEVFLHLLGHTDPCVRDGQPDVFARSNSHMLGRESFMKCHIGCLDDELSTIRHRIPGVDSEVCEDLFDLARIHFDTAEVFGQEGDELNILSDKASKHLIRIENNFVEVEYLWLDHLSAGKGQKLLSESSGPLRGLQNLKKIIVHAVTWVDLHQSQFGVSFNGCQHVIEIVSNATCQPTHRFHFLRPQQLGFKPHLFGDVSGNRQDACRPSFNIP